MSLSIYYIHSSSRKKQLFWFFCVGICIGKKPNVLFVLWLF